MFLTVAGAVLAFGVKAEFSGFDLTTIGYIVVGGGVLVILLDLLLFMPRTRRGRSTAITTDLPGRQGVVERDERISGL